MLPLDGVRIIAVEQYGAGPYGTLQLASLGAEVIKVEQPGDGDVSRSVGPEFIEALPESSSSLFFQALNHDKKSVTLDLNTAEGQARLHRLVADADGLITNLRGDVVDKLGLGYESLASANPALVCTHLTAYGRSGPRADWPGYDYIMQAECGYFSLTGEPGSPPARFGLSTVDLQTGVTMAMALLAGIVQARAQGTGRDLDVSLFDVALHNLNYIAMWEMNSSYEANRAPRSAHLSLTPCQLYKTADGWIYLMCNKEKFWQSLCSLIERPDLLSDPRFCDFAHRLTHRDQLTEVLDAVLSKHSTTIWLDRFAGQVPAAQINSVTDAVSNPFLLETQRTVSVRAREQELRFLRCPVDTGDNVEYQIAPRLGQHDADFK